MKLDVEYDDNVCIVQDNIIITEYLNKIKSNSLNTLIENSK